MQAQVLDSNTFTAENGYVWPNFYIVGGMKCGTTSMYAHLKAHPEVFLPDVKEPHFFADIKRPGRSSSRSPFPNDLEAYQALFRQSRGFKAVGDASPSYLSDENAPELIQSVAPHAKIIIMLRDPVERAFSHYLMPMMRATEPRPFFEAVKQDYALTTKGWNVSRMYVDLGLYYRPVRRYIEAFGRDRVLVVLFQDLAKKTDEVLSQVTSLLDIDPAGFAKTDTSEAHNPYKEVRFQRVYRLASSFVNSDMRQRLPGPVRKWLSGSRLLYRGGAKPKLSIEASRYLQAIYEPDILQLEEYLGRQLPELRRSWL